MLYPFKFNPVYKDYIWGGRGLEKLGKKLPDGIVAESWEISCHPDGVSSVANGELAGVPLDDLVKEYGRDLIGTALPEKDLKKFPLLVKLIDANDRLSVQVHPDDAYAGIHENGEYGKNEAWYIISAKPGARLVLGMKQGVSGQIFKKAAEDDKIDECLKYVSIAAGDVINIPNGLVHAIGDGIVLAEIQQNSNTTYRVYDYGRLDKNGNRRPLHIEKALDVIDFNSEGRNDIAKGLDVKIDSNSHKSYKVANKYFSLEIYDVNGAIRENADGTKFFIYVFVDGEGEIVYEGGGVEAGKGDSVLIPASMGTYSIHGRFKALKTYVPQICTDVIKPLLEAGYTEKDILESVEGLTYLKCL